MKFEYNEQSFDVSKSDAVDYIKSVFLSTIESRQGKADDVTRPDRVVEVLRNLEQGILPSRGSKGSTAEPWAKDRTDIIRSFLQSAGIEFTLKGQANVEAAIAKLAEVYKRDPVELSDDIEARAVNSWNNKQPLNLSK